MPEAPVALYLGAGRTKLKVHALWPLHVSPSGNALSLQGTIFFRTLRDV